MGQKPKANEAARSITSAPPNPNSRRGSRTSVDPDSEFEGPDCVAFVAFDRRKKIPHGFLHDCLRLKPEAEGCERPRVGSVDRVRSGLLTHTFSNVHGEWLPVNYRGSRKPGNWAGSYLETRFLKDPMKEGEDDCTRQKCKGEAFENFTSVYYHVTKYSLSSTPSCFLASSC